MTRLRVLTAVIACVFAAPLTASAAQIILTQNVSGSGSGSASNLNPTTFLSDSFLFNQFDPAAGNLTSAQLEWDFTTSATATPPAPVPDGSPNPFMSGTVQFTFLGDSVSGSFTDVTTVKNFFFTGPDGSTSLALGPLIGTGTFTAGTLAGILDLASPTLFPVGVSGNYIGTLELTYVYEPVRNQVPEPATLLLMGGGLAAAAARRRRR